MRRSLAIFAALAIGVSAGGAWVWGQLRTPYRGFSSPQTFVDIAQGSSRHAIARQLASAGIIRHWLPFEIYSLAHLHHPLEAGEYLFDSAESPCDAFWKIARGRIYVHILVIPEGWTMFDIASALGREGICSREEFLAAAHDTSLIRDLAPDAKNLEGYLSPATYQFTRHETAQEIAEAMVGHFRRQWMELTTLAAASQTGTNMRSDPPDVEEIVEIASLVEKETPKAEERPLIADVFYNRLAKGLPLQCDPTVQYALELAGQQVQTLTSSDLNFASPYNTYLHAGLPPGPIANPGKAALQAALAPAQTDFLYFVADAQGGHFFSRTLAQHNQNVVRYRRRLAGEPDGAPPVSHQRKKRDRR